MTQVMYRKWRPRRWEQVVGQDHVIRTLRNAVAAGRVAHAYLFAGPRGTGKTTTARLLAKAVNCLDPDQASRPCDACDHCLAINAGRFLDLIEIDAASNTSVDDVRDLREKINYAPNLGRYKVYIIDEVHMLSTAAFNALLKTLEEPPSHAIFVLATTEVHKIPATVLSRCQRHEFRRIPVADIVKQLAAMAEGEGLEVGAETLTLVARQATGSLRDAISLLDQLASTGQEITLELAQEVLGTAASQSVLALIDALLDNQPATGLDHIRRTLDAGTDPRQFTRQVVDYLRNVLLVRMGNADHVDAGAETRARMTAHAQAFTVPQLLAVMRAFNAAANEARVAWQPGLPLELAFVESLEVLGQPGPPQPLPDSAPRPKAAPNPSGAPGSLSPPAAGREGDGESGTLAAQAPEGVSLGKIARAWPSILAAVRERNPQTQGLMNSSRPMGLKDGVLILGFASPLLKSKMEKQEHLDHACQVLAQVLGASLKIRCVVASGADRDRLNNLKDLDNDGMVAVALRDLGGEIVDIQ